MKPNRLIVIVLTIFLCCFLFLQTGCEEENMSPGVLNPNWFQQQQWAALNQQAPQRMVATAQPVREEPRIEFEKITHDFGDVGPGSKHICEFRFTNTGNGVLRIGEITQVCGCTPFVLEKREYIPGETGILRVGYFADVQYGDTKKQLFVHSNDRLNSKIALNIESNIVAKVAVEPQSLRLSLKHNNAGCPQIVLASVDNQPFSIRSFKSTGNIITADYNPSVRATSFVLQPVVDMARLEDNLNGRIEIELSHPECRSLTVGVDTLPRYEVSPRSVVVRDAHANQVITKKIRIQSNYNDDFELESVYSKNGTVKILQNQKVDDGYELELSVTPPAQRNRASYFSDEVIVRVKGGKDLKIPFSGHYPVPKAMSIPTGTISSYPTTSSSTKTTTGSSGECKTCGPKIF
ncbi:MAG: DUF1573 domain-containing protein [Sedimentisphaerales bacterium]|nr:DUF1573 domain-containing protein [Sedimentisphaerales bacterium]